MAASKSLSNGNLPNRCDSCDQASTAPGTVTESHPSSGMLLQAAKRCGDQPEGERPEPVAVDARKRLQVDGALRVSAGREDPRARAARQKLRNELEPNSTAGALHEERWR